MDIATIIVNYRTTAAAIDAVAALTGDLDQFADPLVVVVDNDSRDGSFERLTEVFAEARWGGRVVVIGSGHNGGFGYGVNVGVKHVLGAAAPPPYVYVLNPDATIEPGALAGLVEFMKRQPDAGLVGNLVRNGSGDQTTGFRFPSVLGELEGTARFGLLTALLRKHQIVMERTESSEVDWVSGVSMLFRREVFTSAGFFDEGFFLYFEEIDLALRIKQAGWKVFFVGGVAVDHIGGLSTGFNDSTKRLPLYWLESRRRYFVKHHGRVYSAACDAAWLLGHAIFKSKLKVLGRRDTLRPSVGRDLLCYGFVNALKPAPAAAQNASLHATSAVE